MASLPSARSRLRPHAMLRAVVIGCFLVALLSGVVGCRPEEGIRTYTVPKEPMRVADAKPQAAVGESTDRMLVAVVSHGGQATFFKLVGPTVDVESVADDVKAFVESLDVGGDEAPQWKLPEGWREEPGNQFRRATLFVPTDCNSLELAISELPWQSGDDYLLANVNRWRGQMGLPPLTGLPQLKDATESINVGDTEVIWLDITGQSTGGMTPPFVGGQPAVAKPQAAEGTPFEQTAPKEWTVKPASGFRRAAFQVGAEPNTAEVTVFDFSTKSPEMASPLANVNRWRAEEGIGLLPIDEAELAKTAEKVTISGKDGIFVDIEAPEGVEPRKATLAAMTERDGVVWFFKLHGLRETVLPERERFRKWLDSIRFRE